MRQWRNFSQWGFDELWKRLCGKEGEEYFEKYKAEETKQGAYKERGEPRTNPGRGEKIVGLKKNSRLSFQSVDNTLQNGTFPAHAQRFLHCTPEEIGPQALFPCEECFCGHGDPHQPLARFSREANYDTQGPGGGQPSGPRHQAPDGSSDA